MEGNGTVPVGRSAAKAGAAGIGAAEQQPSGSHGERRAMKTYSQTLFFCQRLLHDAFFPCFCFQLGLSIPLYMVMLSHRISVFCLAASALPHVQHRIYQPSLQSSYANIKTVLMLFWTFTLQLSAHSHAAVCIGLVPILATCVMYKYATKQGLAYVSLFVLDEQKILTFLLENPLPSVAYT